MIFLDKENHFSRTKAVLRQWILCVHFYNISIWKLHPIFFSRLTWWKSVVRYFLHLSRDNRLYDEYNLTSDVLLFFQSYQTVRYNEIFKYYLEIIWYEMIHQQIENMMNKSKKKRNMTTRDQRWQLIIRERLSLIRRLSNFWKRFWLFRHHCRTASYWSSATSTWKHKKKRYWLNTVSILTWSSAIGRYQIRMLH